MSEYQYYEFGTDIPLTPDQMSELRELSSRAVITRNRFSNTYHYGDFRGNPRKLMESYFDAHVYVSNFGLMTLMLRLPQTVLPKETLTEYATGEALSGRTTDTHTILEWRMEDEPPGEWMEGEGWLDKLLPIRDELVRGDYRSLYIGWLSSIIDESPDGDEEEEEDYESDELEEEEDEFNSIPGIEPPVPAGLGALTRAQVALAEFLCVDKDLITAAAQASPKVTQSGEADPGVAEWVAQLPESEVRAILTQIIHGEANRIQAELQSRYHRSRSVPTVKVQKKRRTSVELFALATQIASERKQQEVEKRERKRHAHLLEIVPRLSELWARVNALAEEQKSSSYEEVCKLLVDMRDASTQFGHRSEFDAELAQFLARYSRRTALMRRLKAERFLP